MNLYILGLPDTEKSISELYQSVIRNNLDKRYMLWGLYIQIVGLYRILDEVRQRKVYLLVRPCAGEHNDI